ncbi:MAG TPA: glycoside hydrolase family 2 TIM barrel-domain containing protein [Candidatus Paceibacterota bacterium]|nr:glycoside hydrolase family 2 TIM barrel-domain containing protein [Candidatus Paceibacterota bacterium]
MSKRSGWSAAFLLFGALAALAAVPAAPRRVDNFNRDWRFARGTQPGAEAVGFDDSAWTPVRLPHDWAISGPYEPQGDPHTGKLPWRGEGWYRKTFTLPAGDAGKRVYLDFDGVMAMPTVYVNGRKAGGWDYGYMSFRVDATEFVKAGESNLVAVHVDTRPHRSRWYPGAGIYRKVQLVVTEPVHVGEWGVFVTTPSVTAEAAAVRVETCVANHTSAPVDASIETTLRDPRGREVARLRSELAVPAGNAKTGAATLAVPRPQLWDVASPRLYTATTRVYQAGRLVDQVETPFGIRTFQFTANDGFHLNGRRVQLQGVCLHSDLGPLGMAFNRRAMERQLQIMRDMGVNAIRTSHNPPAPELLDLCDRMGMVVWDEAFDKWDGTATLPKGVSVLEHGRKQLSNFVRRDRNHPCVVVWSVGNEITELESLKYPDSPGLLKAMVGLVKEFDTTRPVGLAHCIPESAKSQLPAALDVTGWNYARRYAISRERWPNLPIIYTESASAFSTRGYYDDFPMPAKKDDYPITARISSYDHNSAYYSDPADVEFALMERDRFVAGEFVWTGFDYLGEPAPFIAEGWGHFTRRKLAREEESRISSFGIVDLAGIPKDRLYLYRSHWAPEKKTIHILPHWNWPQRLGRNVPVYVYTSGDSAELFLNGKSLGKRTKNPEAEVVRDRYALRWLEVPYEPGELKVVAWQGGRRLGAAIMRTAGEPAALRLTPDRKALVADGDDLSFVLVEAVDQQGTLCPLAMNDVKFRIEGPATLAGVGNGDHHFPAEFDSDQVSLFYGKAMLIVRTTEGRGGHIRVTAASPGLREATASLRSRPPR